MHSLEIKMAALGILLTLVKLKTGMHDIIV